ncbi:unnamed protein product [Nesidiocoris tenuis]|uniref:Uncharacterized protein n=1 Tax=Nesidiocoris tenuis TaxID=355587 RepID=A0A6H5GMI1_9HEMI|nr:unnamed protein product [Nesidiocoris tenuis]
MAKQPKSCSKKQKCQKWQTAIPVSSPSISELFSVIESTSLLNLFSLASKVVKII